MASVKKKTIIFIVGPTAIGKTSLAVKLANRINGEIISSDSMQVYKGMTVLSQAAGASDTKKIKHHLIGFLDPKKEYSVAIFRKKAIRIINSLIKEKKTPIVVGGGGLYIKALVDGLFLSPAQDAVFRKKMWSYVSRYGSTKLHERLIKTDPGSAGRIHPNDAKRIIRALEIHHTTGRTMTEMKERTKGLAGRYDIKIFGLIRSRRHIYENINARVERMFGEDVVAEVESLKDKTLSTTAKGVLGLNEITAYIDGRYDFETAKEFIKKNTRRFAKRQLTWFRVDKRIRWFNMDRMSEPAVITAIRKSLKG